MSEFEIKALLKVLRGSSDKLMHDFATSISKRERAQGMVEGSLDSTGGPSARLIRAAIGTSCDCTQQEILGLMGMTLDEAISVIDPFKRAKNKNTLFVSCREMVKIDICETGSESLLH